MRKAASYTLIFAGGFAAAYVAFRFLPWPGRTIRSDQRAVLATLDRTVPHNPIPDNALVKAAAIIQPSVVNIDTMEERERQDVDVFGQSAPGRMRFQGTGSGVILSHDGYIATNYHVVAGATIIRVTLHDGRKFDGRIVGADQSADIAVVKVEAYSLPTAVLGDSQKLKVGEYVLAIGNPLGIGTTVTHGIVSATDRHDLHVGNGRILREAIQTDAPINRGNSGGALANLNGELVGINTAIASEGGGGSIGIGFAIPTSVARRVLRELVLMGKTTRARPRVAFIGIEFGEVPRQMSDALGLAPGQGVVVADVKPLTAAADAGLKPGDVILALDGRVITASADMLSLIGDKKVGDAVALRVMRGFGKTEEVKLVLGEKPDQYLER